MNPFFEGNKSNNLKYFLTFIIITLHKELNINSQMNKGNQQIIIDKRNQILIYQNFMQEINLYNNSIISQLFYGINCNIVRCCNCNSQTYAFQTYFLIDFPLEKVYDYKNILIKMQSQVNNLNNMQNNFNNSNINQSNHYNNNNKAMNYNNYEINIYDCFEFDRRVNFYDGDNLMYCDYCKMNSNFYLCKNLINGPKILIILLNNGRGNSKIKFKFVDNLNLYNYIQNNNTGYSYKLIGVITHNDMGSSFIAFCIDPITNKWVKYNDINVCEVKDFQNEVIQSTIPYILFYQKVNC